MLSAPRSVLVWVTTCILILLWLPLVALVRLFDRDPVAYRTGRTFRRLGKALTAANPAWKVKISGVSIPNPRNPYVVVSNHQSLADIPIISNLAWEMKWVAKVELFRLPIIGWMLRLAKDIPVDRGNARSGAHALLKAKDVLSKHCSVIIFPEGTRSRDGRLYEFTDGAFHLAVKAQVPVLPIAVDGSASCLPKKSWRFGEAQDINVRVLEPIATAGLGKDDVEGLKTRVRSAIVKQVAEWRQQKVEEIDATFARVRA